VPLFKSRLVPVLIIDTFVFLIGILGFIQNIDKAGLNPDTHVSFDLQNEHLVVREIHTPQFSNLLANDTLEKIGSFEPRSKEELEFILDGYEQGESAEFTVIRSGSSYIFNFQIPPYYHNIYLIIQLLIGLSFLILGIFVLYKQPVLLVARVWHWASIGTAAIILCTFGHYPLDNLASGIIVRVAFLTAYAFVPTLFLYISFIFPGIKWPGFRKLITVLFGVSVVLVVTEIYLFIRAIQPVSIEAYHLFVFVFDLNRAYFASGLLFGVGNLIHSYFTFREDSEKRKIRWVLLGLCTGPPIFIIFWQIPQLLSFDALLPEEFIVLIMIIVPVTFSIAIIRYNILNIDLLIRRSTVYFFIVSCLFTIYAFIVVGVIMLIGTLTIQTSLIFSIIVAILTPLLFDRVRRLIHGFINRKFFRVNYNYRVAQQQFTKRINECVDTASISTLVVSNIDELLGVSFSSFYLLNPFTREWQFREGTDGSIDSIVLKNIVEIIKDKKERIFTPAKNLVEPDLETGILDDIPAVADEVGLVVITKSQNADTNSVLVTGPKKSGTRFNLDDIDLLKTISAETGPAIERMSLQQKLFLREMETEYLKEINSIKSTFVSSVSHELSTPLSAIKMFAELLQQKQEISKSTRTEYLAIIESESDRLGQYIKNVLDFSKIERGEMSYHPESLGLNAVITNVLNLMQFQLAQHGFEVDIRLSLSEITLMVDKNALTAALINLFYNAIKYSENEKYIRVETSADEVEATVTITDRGIGIATDDQKKIFDTFYRSKDNKVQSLGGAGLGLSLVAHFVIAHSGKIDLESELGKGSIFRLILPVVLS